MILDKNSLGVFTILYVKTEVKKAELFDLRNGTGNKGKYRMACLSAINQKLTI